MKFKQCCNAMTPRQGAQAVFLRMARFGRNNELGLAGLQRTQHFLYLRDLNAEPTHGRPIRP
jgi:hypothetical protein